MYKGSVSYSLASAGVPTVNVTLVVEASGQSSGQNRGGQLSLPSAASSAAASCTPTQIILTQTALVNNFDTPASWPTELEIQLDNARGSPVTNGQIVTTFSNGDPPLALTMENSSSGLYSGTWTPGIPGRK